MILTEDKPGKTEDEEQTVAENTAPALAMAQSPEDRYESTNNHKERNGGRPWTVINVHASYKAQACK